MDNLCHSLVGAALGEAGLKRRTAYGMAVLMIGANLPDVDVLAVPLGHGLAFRRGWTHGIPALVVLPAVMTLLFVLYDRWRRSRGRPPELPFRPGQVLLLAYLSCWTHPVLDWMNTYGMRWLMPMRDEWFHGDSLFIIDPWMLLGLGAGALLSRARWRRGSPRPGRPARVGLALVAGYVAAMLGAGLAGRALVREALAERGVGPEARLLVSPVPVDPFRREVVFRDGERIGFGTLTWLPAPRVVLLDSSVETNADAPAARAAAALPEARPFLHWARFPFFVVQPAADATVVHVLDARYTTTPDARIGSLTVRLPWAAPTSGGRPGP